jgi:hypothetical protein
MVLIMIFRPRGILATRKPTITLHKKEVTKWHKNY